MLAKLRTLCDGHGGGDRKPEDVPDERVVGRARVGDLREEVVRRLVRVRQERRDRLLSIPSQYGTVVRTDHRVNRARTTMMLGAASFRDFSMNCVKTCAK